LDLAQRRAMERPAEDFSVIEHVLASIARLDRLGCVAPGVGPVASQARSSRSSRLVRSHRRWHICLGKKGGDCVGKTKRGKGTKIMALTEGHGLPLGIHITSASPNEVTLIEPLLEKRVVQRRLHRLIYDRAADSDPLRERLARRRIELVCPHRINRSKPPTQDGRKLRRYKRRWKIERSISWLQNFRRLVTRYEYHAHLFLGFVQLACLLIVLRRF
jgi:transposase